MENWQSCDYCTLVNKPADIIMGCSHAALLLHSEQLEERLFFFLRTWRLERVFLLFLNIQKKKNLNQKRTLQHVSLIAISPADCNKKVT